jgi:hypothetical protein
MVRRDPRIYAPVPTKPSHRLQFGNAAQILVEVSAYLHLGPGSRLRHQCGGSSPHDRNLCRTWIVRRSSGRRSARGIRFADTGRFRMATGVGSAPDDCPKSHRSVDAPPPNGRIEFSEVPPKHRANMISLGVWPAELFVPGRRPIRQGHGHFAPATGTLS